jgi:hypothetical protein
MVFNATFNNISVTSWWQSVSDIIDKRVQEIVFYGDRIKEVLMYMYIPGDCRGHDRMVVGFTTTYAINPITTNVVSSNPAQGSCSRYNIMVLVYQ